MQRDPAAELLPSPMSCGHWLEYFRANAQSLIALPWDESAPITAAERDAIAASIAEFQLGESSEGKHFTGFARAYAARSGDGGYVAALSAFIAEEHRHARDLGRFMDMAGIPRAGRSWPDSVFRWMRKRAGLELSITVLVTAEIIARVYYAALQQATQSVVLRTLCTQILQDEIKHVQFQCERIAILRRGRVNWIITLQQFAHRFLMAGTCLVVWHKHGRAMRAGGYGFGRFWMQTWQYMRDALRQMHPASYVRVDDTSEPSSQPATATV
jgi:hypothetical protein